MKLEYNACPVCFKERKGTESKCTKCGFEYVQIDTETDSDIDAVERAIKERKKWYNSSSAINLYAILFSLSASLLLTCSTTNESESIFSSSQLSNFVIWLIFTSAVSAAMVRIIRFSSSDSKFIDLRNNLIREEERKEEEQKALELARQKALEYEEQERAAAEKHKKFMDDLHSKYGPVSRVIRLYPSTEEFNIDRDIVVFGDTKHIFIEGNPYKFSDVLNCEVEDNATIQHGQTVTKSRLNTTDGILSGLELMGGHTGFATALGATGDRVIVTQKAPDVTNHNYQVYITVNRLENSIIKLDLGYRGKLAREVTGLMTVIMAQK